MLREHKKLPPSLFASDQKINDDSIKKRKLIMDN